jgi:hypothetical protein
VLLSSLVPLWREQVPSGLLSGYPDALAGLDPAPLRGYLTGSLDAVLRVGGRYVVVDYKTNRLGVRGRPLTTWDYRPEALEQAMVDSHYPLQALAVRRRAAPLPALAPAGATTRRCTSAVRCTSSCGDDRADGGAGSSPGDRPLRW